MTTTAKAAALAACILAALPSAAAADVQVGSSGWSWGTPSPQGGTITAAAFAGSSGFAAGPFGTLIRTTDGGATWTGLRSGTFSALDEVQALDQDSLFAGGECAARRSDDGGRTFTRVAFTPVESRCREGLADAHFVSPTTGFLTLTDGTVLLTTDNGRSFSPRTAVPGGRATGDLVFLSERTGIASSGGTLFRTDDGAGSWKEVHSGGAVSDLHFTSPSDGVAVGADGTFLRTDDGGATWTKGALGVQDDLRAVSCADAQTCLASTVDGRALVRTTDGGKTGTRTTVSTRPIAVTAFASPTRVVALGERGATALSDDAGATFAPVGGTLPGDFHAVETTTGKDAYALGGDGALARTGDGGRTWTRAAVPTSELVLDVAFPTAAAGFALDEAGGLFATTDGGAGWRTLDTGAPAAPTAVLAPSPSVVMVLGGFGLRRSADGGETFTPAGGRALRGLTRADEAGAALLAFSSQRVVRSVDGGRRWTAIPLPSRRTRVRALDFVSAGTGYLIDSAGRTWRTDTSGRRWTELPATGFGDPSDVVFGTKDRGYLLIGRFGSPAVTGGWLLRTEDGGRTWAPQVVVPDPIGPGALAAGRDGTDHLLAAAGLLHTRTGGASGEPSALTISTPRRRVRRPQTITVSGRLQPGAANDEVTVSFRPAGSTRWRSQTVRTASNGAFTTRWRVGRGTHAFVAQWAGGFRSRGDGSPVLPVAVR